MQRTKAAWDYLIVTASNERQAEAYAAQLAVRRKLGLLAGFRHAMVVADPGGVRIGSGGSTILCWMRVLDREGVRRRADAEDVLRKLRILIVHAGGDSRRLPAYGACGKLFIPLPGGPKLAVPATLFDLLVPRFAALPPGPAGAGQTVATSGDALLEFDPRGVALDAPGLVAVACPATPEAASKHGVFVPGPGGRVRIYLQKPPADEQRRAGALDTQGQALLDVGVMSFDAATASALLGAVGATPAAGGWRWSRAADALIGRRGLDLYREICCALGDEATAAHHERSARGSGSSWPSADLARLFARIHAVPFGVVAVPACGFLHFGTTRQLITSGLELAGRRDRTGAASVIALCNRRRPGGSIRGSRSWVEGCDLAAPLVLGGGNVVTGVDVTRRLDLPAGAALDVCSGRARNRRRVWFVRIHGVGDSFKDPVARGGTFCDRPMTGWLEAAGATPEDVWDAAIPPEKRTLWDARVFPAEARADGYRRWLWMFAPEQATPAQRAAWRAADRYSAAEIAVLADAKAFAARRAAYHAAAKRRTR